MLKIALLHPFPSSRRHVIRVDMPVPVDVIRLAFWMEVFMKISNAKERTVSIARAETMSKFKILMDHIRISVDNLYASDFFICVANCLRRATKAVEATDSVRSRR